jgi:hypothetical protein
LTRDERLGDRRASMRFEIIGDLWATLFTQQAMPVLTIAPGGVLVESSTPLVVGSNQRLRLFIGDELGEVNASVSHVRPKPGQPDRYLVGMAFRDLTAATRQRIDALVAARLAAGAIGEA